MGLRRKLEDDAASPRNIITEPHAEPHMGCRMAVGEADRKQSRTE